jgi:rod shape determining protein RodA
MALTARRVEPVTILQRERPLRPDLLLVLSYIALSALGIIMVYSASAPRLEALGEDPASLVRRHTVFVVVGIVAFVAASALSGRTLRTLSPGIYLGALAALVAVLFAPAVAGVNRWVQLGPFRFQPSEFAKVALILALALLLSGARDRLRLDHIARAMVLVAIPAGMTFLQPDLGTMLVFGFIALLMLFAAGTTWRQFAFLLLVAIIGAIALFQVGALRDYQLTRLTAFLDPTSDLDATALYNQRQSEIAIGSGGFLGKGLFEGTQTNLSYVPEQATDFIFTAVGEQLGFIGGAIVIGLYAILVWRILVASLSGRDRFTRFVAVGVASLIVFHVFVNIGMTMRLMPVTGLPLPFLSAGGSAFIAMSIAVGMAHAVWMRRSPVPE